jgi:probable rRNA maturation factor
MPLNFFNKNIKASTPQKQKLLLRIHLLSLVEEKEIGDINVIYVSDKELLGINQKYLRHNYLTDIITFDYSKKNILSGDLFISALRVKENSKNYQVPYPEELHRVIIHGILHLAGYKDKSKRDIKTIRGKEQFYLTSL